MALITYANKQAMGTQPSIPEVNKITDSNMNEIKDAVNSLEPVTLYDNSSGSSGTITLNDSVANYKYIDIVFEGNNHTKDCLRTYNPNGKSINLFTGNSNGVYVWIQLENLSFSGVTINRGSQYEIAFTSSGVSNLYTNNIYISKVVGYK